VRRRPLLRLTLAGTVGTGLIAVALLAVPSNSTAAKPATTASSAKPIYISMGDSYSVGYQTSALGNTSGFTGFVARKERYQLANFGCGGATTGSLFTQISCPAGSSAATDAVPYSSTSQVQAALDYIAAPANAGNVKLITVSIGGNDVTRCASSPDPVGCVSTATTTIQRNVTSLVTQLDSALAIHGDTSAHIVGITYPDVFLGDYVAPVGSPNKQLAILSKLAFDALINPALNTAYSGVTRGAFVNVTGAAYGIATAGDDTGSFDNTTYAYTGPTGALPGFGRAIPAPVVEVCSITWYCNPLTFGDIHANTKGYNFIGSLIVAKLAVL
jgi:lysophospholipase L1-like esterase